jgi:hypothetical protein
VPGRSFLYFAWFEKRENETEKELLARQKAERPDHLRYFHIKAGFKYEYKLLSTDRRYAVIPEL